jgi:hypothetical protein
VRRKENKTATATTVVPSTPNTAMSNCSRGGWDEDEKDEDEGHGRDDDAMTEEEDDKRMTTKDDEGLTTKGRGRTREMMAQETLLTSLGP